MGLLLRQISEEVGLVLTVVTELKDKNLTYTKDIIYELEHSLGLFGGANKFYFIYDADYFKDKETVDRLKLLTQNTDVTCVVEDIDKKCYFYKTFCKSLKLKDKQTLNDKVKAFLKNFSRINSIEEKEIVSFFYALYYRNCRYSGIAGECINMVLTGKLKPNNAMQHFIITIVDNLAPICYNKLR